MPKPSEIRTYTQGDDIKPQITVYSDNAKTQKANITSWTFKADLIDSLSCKIATLDIDTSALASSTFRVLISRDITALLTPDTYSYDLTIRDAANSQKAAYTYYLEILKMNTQWT